MACIEQHICIIFNTFSGSSFRVVFRHMSKHRSDPQLCIVCGIGSCNEMYKNYDSYRTHVYRKHREYLLASFESESPTIRSNTDDFNLEDSVGPESHTRYTDRNFFKKISCTVVIEDS